MLNAFPDEFLERQNLVAKTRGELAKKEVELFGWHHAQIGALYLESNTMPAGIVEAILFQFEPGRAPMSSKLAAGVQVAEAIARFGGCKASFDNIDEIAYEDWDQLEGWNILFGVGKVEQQFARASILSCVERLPTILKGLL
jgi:HD-like signal output (HDOD) protein